MFWSKKKTDALQKSLTLDILRRRAEINLEIRETKLKIEKETFAFNLKWKEKNNETYVARRQAAIEMAKKAQSDGASSKDILMLLMIADQGAFELAKIEAIQKMQPNQITAMRASAGSLGKGFSEVMRPVELESQVANLIGIVKKLETEKAQLQASVDKKDNLVGDMVGKVAPRQPKITREQCPRCKAERTFRDGSCLTCGCSSTVFVALEGELMPETAATC